MHSSYNANLRAPESQRASSRALCHVLRVLPRGRPDCDRATTQARVLADDALGVRAAGVLRGARLLSGGCVPCAQPPVQVESARRQVRVDLRRRRLPGESRTSL